MFTRFRCAWCSCLPLPERHVQHTTSTCFTRFSCAWCSHLPLPEHYVQQEHVLHASVVRDAHVFHQLNIMFSKTMFCEILELFWFSNGYNLKEINRFLPKLNMNYHKHNKEVYKAWKRLQRLQTMSCWTRTRPTVKICTPTVEQLRNRVAGKNYST